MTTSLDEQEHQPGQEWSLLGCPIVGIIELISWWRLVTNVVPKLFQQVSIWRQWTEAHEDGHAQFSHSGTDVTESVQLEEGEGGWAMLLKNHHFHQEEIESETS